MMYSNIAVSTVHTTKWLLLMDCHCAKASADFTQSLSRQELCTRHSVDEGMTDRLVAAENRCRLSDQWTVMHAMGMFRQPTALKGMRQHPMCFTTYSVQCNGHPP